MEGMQFWLRQRRPHWAGGTWNRVYLTEEHSREKSQLAVRAQGRAPGLPGSRNAEGAVSLRGGSEMWSGGLWHLERTRAFALRWETTGGLWARWHGLAQGHRGAPENTAGGKRASREATAGVRRGRRSSSGRGRSWWWEEVRFQTVFSDKSDTGCERSNMGGPTCLAWASGRTPYFHLVRWRRRSWFLFVLFWLGEGETRGSV